MSRRFFVDQNFGSVGTVVAMNGSEYNDERRHLHRVMRKQVGDRVILTNGRGAEAEAEIVQLDKQNASFRLLSIREIPKALPEITLVQGILKGPRMDWLVEKLTELGVAALQPALSQNVATADGSEDTRKRRERWQRWQRLSLAAVKQSGASSPLRIQEALELSQVNPDASLAIFCSFQATAKPVGEVLKICKGSNEKNLLIAVGPESGFSEEEETLLKKKGFLPVSLGATTLRGETAGLVACALARDWIDFYRRNEL